MSSPRSRRSVAAVRHLLRYRAQVGLLVVMSLLSTVPLFAIVPAAAADPVASDGSTAKKEISSLLQQFTDFDWDGDGIVEIESLRLFDTSAATGSKDEPPANFGEGRPIIVLLEPRLLSFDDSDKAQHELLVRRLGEFEQALRADGWAPLLIEAKVDSGKEHQDGKTVLALRRFFQQLRDRQPDFAGAILIGSFPEAMLVRRWLWKHDDRQIELAGVTYNGGRGPRATYLAMDPELVAPRSDIVLADLDGNWEKLYVQGPIEIDSIALIPEVEAGEQWPVRDRPLVSTAFSIRPKQFEDFFRIEDCDLEIIERTENRLVIRAGYEPLRPEATNDDRQRANPIARPEIVISRIDPSHVAVEGAAEDLDDQGVPRAVPLSAGDPQTRLVRSSRLERRLLIEYLERNLAYRAGSISDEARRAAVISTDLETIRPNYFDQLASDFGPTVNIRRATVLDFVKFMRTPALVKGISAHSDPSCSMMLGGYDLAELDTLTGGGYWHWTQVDDRFKPNYGDSAVRDRIHFALLRTLWSRDALRHAGPSFYVHAGCEVNTPLNAARVPYHSPHYAGHTQIAENLLFYGNGLALLSRAKVFYDAPRGFSEAFGAEQGNFGATWTAYFEHESHDEQMGRDVAGYDRAYFWSLLGDWTLDLKPATTDRSSD